MEPTHRGSHQPLPTYNQQPGRAAAEADPTNRLQALAARLAPEHLERFEATMGQADAARQNMGEVALSTAHNIVGSGNVFDRDMLGKMNFTHEISKSALDSHQVAERAADRHGLRVPESKPFDPFEVIKDPDGYLNGIFEGTHQKARQGRTAAIGRAADIVRNFVSDVEKSAVKAVEERVGGAALVKQLAEHGHAIRGVGTEYFDERFEDLFARLEEATSVEVAQTVGGRVLRGVGLKKTTFKEDMARMSKSSSVAWVLREFEGFVKDSARQQFTPFGGELHVQVQTKLTELGIEKPSDERIASVKASILRQAKQKLEPQNLERLVDAFMVQEIIPDLESKGLFSRAEQQTGSRQQNTQSSIREKTNLKFEHAVDQEIARLKAEGRNDRDIKRALTKKYHPDVSHDQDAQEKIRYINGLFS